MNEKEVRMQNKNVSRKQLNINLSVDEMLVKKHILYLLDEHNDIVKEGEYYIKRLPLHYQQFKGMDEENFEMVIESIKKDFVNLAKKYNIDSYIAYESPFFYMHISSCSIGREMENAKFSSLVANRILDIMDANEDFVNNPNRYLQEDPSFVEWLNNTALENIKPSDNLKEFYNETVNLLRNHLEKTN